MSAALPATHVACPECKTPLVIPLNLQMTSMVTAEVRFDLSAVQAHIGEHLAAGAGLGGAYQEPPCDRP